MPRLRAAELAERFGSRPWASYLEPAIAAAEEGAIVTSFMYGLNFALFDFGFLGDLRDNVNTGTLIRLLDDRPAVRRAALEALPKVVETPFATEPPEGSVAPEKVAERWKDWYREQGKGGLISL